MCGEIEVASSRTLHIVDAVTSFEHNRVQVLLLGIGGLTHDQIITQYESLLNYRHMHDNGFVV